MYFLSFVKDGWVIAVAWGTEYYALGSSTGQIHVFDSNGKPVAEFVLDGLNPCPVGLRFDDSALVVVSIDDNLEMRIDRWEGGRLEQVAREKVESHSAVAVGPGPSVAFVPSDRSEERGPGRAYVVRPDAEQADDESCGEPLRGEVRALGFSFDGNRIAVLDGKAFRIFETATKARGISIDLGDRKSIRGMTLSPDSKSIATWEDEREIMLWSSEDARLQRSLTVSSKVSAAAFLDADNLLIGADSGLLLVGSDGVERELLGLRQVSVLGIFRDRQSLALSAWGPGESDPVLVMYDLRSKEPVLFRGGRGAVCGASISADGKLLLMNTGGGKSVLWSLPDGRRLRQIDVDPRVPWLPCFAPSGSNCFAWPEPGEYDRYRLRIARGAKDDGIAIDGPVGASGLYWSPDGSRLLATKTAESWLVDPHPAVVVAEIATGGRAAWSPDSKLVAVTQGTFGVSYSLWSAGGEQLGVYEAGGIIEALAFSPDGTFLATATQAGEVRVYRAP